MAEIPQGGAARADGLGEHFFDGLSEPGIALSRNPARGTAGSDARVEQGLDGVDVADPNNVFLVHQKSLDAGAPLSAALEEIITGEFR